MPTIEADRRQYVRPIYPAHARALNADRHADRACWTSNIRKSRLLKFPVTLVPSRVGKLMRRIAPVLASALVVAMAVEPAAAQSAAPVVKFETEPFSGSELLNGKWLTEDQCASLPGAVWVVVDRQ